MLFLFKGASRILAIEVLTGLQIGVFYLYPFFFGPRDELDHLRFVDRWLQSQYLPHYCILRARCTLALMEEFPVAPFVNFGKFTGV